MLLSYPEKQQHNLPLCYGNSYTLFF